MGRNHDLPATQKVAIVEWCGGRREHYQRRGPIAKKCHNATSWGRLSGKHTGKKVPPEWVVKGQVEGP